MKSWCVEICRHNNLAICRGPKLYMCSAKVKILSTSGGKITEDLQYHQFASIIGQNNHKSALLPASCYSSRSRNFTHESDATISQNFSWLEMNWLGTQNLATWLQPRVVGYWPPKTEIKTWNLIHPTIQHRVCNSWNLSPLLYCMRTILPLVLPFSASIRTNRCYDALRARREYPPSIPDYAKLLGIDCVLSNFWNYGPDCNGADTCELPRADCRRTKNVDSWDSATETIEGDYN